MSKTALCVAYYFPPESSTGVHRTRAIVRHLPAHGWRPVVISAELPADATQDPSLLQGLPNDLVVYRTLAPSLLSWGNQLRDRFQRLLRRGMCVTQRPEFGAPPTELLEPVGGWVDWASWWLQIPDLNIGWLANGFRAARRAVYRHHCQAIYSSAPPFTTHLIALLVKRQTGLPWVADFRDPWRANPFRKIPYRSADRYDAWLERRVVCRADWVICNTDAVRDDFMRRYPELGQKFITVSNGFDPEDFADLTPQRDTKVEKLLLTHAGCFYGKRRPDALFQALGILRDGGLLQREPCLQLIGPPYYEGRDLGAIAARYGVGNMVFVRGEVPHRQALELMRGSDVQVLVGFNGVGAELQTPAKLFEYLGVGKPVLALAPERSAIAEVVARSGTIGAVCDPDSPEHIAEGIVRLASRTNGSSGVPLLANGVSPIRQFYRREQVGQIAQLLADSTDLAFIPQHCH